MRSYLIKFGLIVVALASTSCSVNILDPFAKDDTDFALFEEAKIELNKGSYSSAIELFGQMSSKFLSEDDVVAYHASAYAGRCGLDFLNFLNVIQDISSSRLFLILMSAFTGGDTDTKDSQILDCDSAISIIEAKWPTVSDRDDDGNLLHSFVLFAKIGKTFARWADEDATEGNDGALDSDFDACDTADMADEDTREWGAAMMKMLSSLAAVSSVSVGSDSITAINDICTTLASAVPATADLCNKTDPDDFTADEVKGLRTLMHEGNDVGLGSCTNSPPTIANGCVCP